MEILEANVRQVLTHDISALSTAMKYDKNYARIRSRIWAQHLVHEAGAKSTPVSTQMNHCVHERQKQKSGVLTVNRVTRS
jgi:hypothetical protein